MCLILIVLCTVLLPHCVHTQDDLDVRDALTKLDVWNDLLDRGSNQILKMQENICYRRTKNLRSLRLIPESEKWVQHIRTYCFTNDIPIELSSVILAPCNEMFKGTSFYKKAFVGSSSGTLYTIEVGDDEKLSKYSFNSQAHRTAITAIWPLTEKYLVLGGDQSITFMLLDATDDKHDVLHRVEIPTIGIITHLHAYRAQLIATTWDAASEKQHQYILYPFNCIVYNQLSSENKNKLMKNLLLKLVKAMGGEKSLDLSPFESAMIKRNTSLSALLEVFFKLNL